MDSKKKTKRIINNNNNAFYPSMDEWVTMSYIYIMEYYSAIKRTEIMLNKDISGPRDCHTE